MFGESERNMLARGAKRQGKSGAWIFPVNPKEKEQANKMKEIEEELNEVRKLKKELNELKDNLTSK